MFSLSESFSFNYYPNLQELDISDNVGIDQNDFIYLFNAIVKAGNAWKISKLNISNIDLRAKASKFLANCISS